MKKRALTSINEIIKRYKPIDIKLRKYSSYAKISDRVHRFYLWTYSYSKIGQYYVNNHHTKIIPNTILLDSYWGQKIGCNPYAIYRALRESSNGSNLKFIWVKDKDIKISKDLLKASNIQFVQYNTRAYADALNTAETLIFNMNLPPYFSPKAEQTLVNTWHGIPMKTLGYESENNFSKIFNTQRNFLISDHIIMASEYAANKTIGKSEKIIATGANLNNSSVRKIGSPRIDLTLKANRDIIRSKLNITEDKKVILYAPTWRGTVGNVSNQIKFQIDAIESISNELAKDYHLVVSLHHFTKKRLGNLPSNISYLPDDVEINEFLSTVDVLVSDYSSILIDYLILNKPIILFIPDYDQYYEERGLYLKPSDLPVNNCFKAKELAETILTAKKPSCFDNYETTINLLIPNEDGKASQRVVDLLQTKKNKPLETEVNDRKKILLFPGGLQQNGITSSFFNLLANIDQREYDVTILVHSPILDRNANSSLKIRELLASFNIISINPSYINTLSERQAIRSLESHTKEPLAEQFGTAHTAYQREARRLLNDMHFDTAIDFAGYSPYWTGVIAALNADKKIIFQHSDMWAEITNPQKRHSKVIAVLRQYKYYDAIISSSEEIMRINESKVAKYYPSNANISYADNTLNLKSIFEKSKIPLSLTTSNIPSFSELGDYTKFIFIARLSPEKNHSRLLRAFSKVKNKKTLLFVVGGGVLEKELKQEASKLGINERIVFTGYLSNPYPVLMACDCMVLSSDYEGQGLVLLEAMTLGIPCIGSDIPPVRKIIEKNGGIIAPKTVNGFTNAMETFLLDPSKYTPHFDAVEYNKNAINQFDNLIKH